MARVYRLYLKLFEQWPVDPSKKNRDLGQFIREQVKLNFLPPDHIPIQTEAECLKTYERLKRISDNYYKKHYDRLGTSSATGLTAEQCKTVLSDDFLEFLEKDKRSIIDQFFSKK